MALAAIALGSNLPGVFGTGEQLLCAAVRRVGLFGHLQGVSSFLETAPVGYADQPPFLNAAVLLETEFAPEILLDHLLALELEFGRDRSHGIANGPRTLDLDLLLYNGLVMKTPKLVVPHPEMHRRRFVLEPLAEIARDLRHPILRQSMAELLARLPE